MATARSTTVFQLRIALDDVEPTVWRRVLVPGSFRLDKVHSILQAAMGWTNAHLHAFTIGDDRYAMCFEDDDFDDDEIDERDATLLDALGDHTRFRYEYDFGDGWNHEVLVEDRHASRHGLKYAVCIAGENACPPEDCGGPGGYSELVEVLADLTHEDRDGLLEWLGGPFDAAHFDLAEANAALQRVR